MKKHQKLLSETNRALLLHLRSKIMKEIAHVDKMIIATTRSEEVKMITRGLRFIK